MSDERKYWGKYKGFIRENVDPENRGRVRVYCPQVMGPRDADAQWLDWAEPCHPWLGGLTSGDSGPPFTRKQQMDDFGSEWYGVWIEFQDGNPDFPIWVGTFNIAPEPSSASAHTMGVDGGAGVNGGGIFENPPAGSDLSALNPPKSEVSREVRLRAPRGVDIVIGVEGGGYVIIGQSGVHITGVQATINGRLMNSSSMKVTG
jgi:hypothetical protein